MSGMDPAYTITPQELGEPSFHSTCDARQCRLDYRHQDNRQQVITKYAFDALRLEQPPDGLRRPAAFERRRRLPPAPGRMQRFDGSRGRR